MSYHRRSLGQRLLVIMVFSFCLILVLNALSGLLTIPITADTLADTTEDRDIMACTGSEPPPKDISGERYGDWIIDCPPTTPVTISNEVFSLNGNMTLVGNTIVKITDGSKVTQKYSVGSRRFLTLESGTTLTLESGSELKVDSFNARHSSILNIGDSKFYAGGYFNFSGDDLNILDSDIINQGLFGSTGQKGADAYMFIKAKSTALTGSIVLNMGGDGGAGDAGIPGGAGGNSIAKLLFDDGTLSNMIINTSGGNGGAGRDAFTGAGSSSGPGGTSQLELGSISGADLDLNGTDISVIGGAGGKGGNGAIGQSGPGGNGGRGGDGGKANMTLWGNAIRIDNGDIMVRGGSPGRGGSGGEASEGMGGDGGDSGMGGQSSIVVSSGGSFKITDSSLRSIGGIGADGGFFGSAQAEGSAGDAGGGGDASLSLNIKGEYMGTNSTVQAIGGYGGHGGLGKITAGDGGDGGDATCNMEAGPIFVHTGIPDDLAILGSIGGDGGTGGDAVGASGNGDGLKGRGGVGGSAFTTIGSTWSVDLVNARIRASRGLGGTGGKAGANGLGQIIIDTDRFNSTNSLSDQTLEGFDGTDQGVLKNTTVTAFPNAIVAPGEPNARVDIYWYVNVGIPKANWSDTWQVDVYEGSLEDGNIVDSGSIVGPNDRISFLLLGEIVTAQGTQSLNYTVHGTLSGSNMGTKAQNVLLTTNQDVRLQPSSCSICTPHVSILEPRPDEVIRSDDQDPCREATQAEIDMGLKAPGCIRIQGSAYLDDTNPEGGIEDIQLILEHDHMGMFIFTKNSVPPLTIKDPGSRMTDWSFNWEIGDLNMEENAYKWDEGQWDLTVRSYDGTYWSDDPDHGSPTVIKITLVHPSPPEPTIKIDAGFPIAVEMRSKDNGANVTFNDAKVETNQFVSIIRMEWDYNGDDETDWSSVSTHCDKNGTCDAPISSYIYTQSGLYNARFCVIDNNGVRKCDTKKILVQLPPTSSPIGISPELMFMSTVLIVAVCSVITTSLIIASLSEAARYAIMSFILVPLYTRLRKEELLDNYTRGEIRGYIVANPGAHYSRIKRDLILNNGTLIYHLRTLEREGFIYSHRDDYYRRFYPRGRKPRPGPNLTTVQESIIEMLLTEPDRTADQLAKVLEKSRKVVNYHLVWLKRWGLVEAKKKGRMKTYSVIYEDDMEMEEDSGDQEAPEKT